MSFQEKLESLSTLLEDLASECKQNEEYRKTLHLKLQSHAQQLESPAEAAWRWMMSPHEYTLVRVAIDMDLFRVMHEFSGPKSATEIATKVGAEKELIVRTMRPLSRMNVFVETGEEEFASGPIASFLAQAPAIVAGLKFMFDAPGRALVGLPSYLSSNSFKEPSDFPGPFQYALQTSDPMFYWMMKNPSLMESFGIFMSAQRHDRKQWFDFYPVQERLIKDNTTEASEAFLVDVGGGKGHELQAFLDRFGPQSGKLVLQDLPPVIQSIEPAELDSSITRMEHDFFTAQPVIGARTYYCRSVPHDWPDKACLEILGNIAKAMKPNYSKLLINEWILPNTGAGLYPSLLDINMMVLFSGKERTQRQWENLLAQVGLEIVGIWNVDQETEGVIEAMKKS